MNALKKQTYTIREAAEYLSVSDDTIRRLVKRGVLRRSLAVRKILISAEDVENFIAKTG